MFHDEDPTYAIKLLKRLRRDKVIIISDVAPSGLKLSPDRKKPKREAESLEGAAAATVDLAGSRPGEMVRPCIYIHPKGFLATGQRATDAALYRLKPHLQRAVAILHELGHVAGILQEDDLKRDKLAEKSKANTNCVRLNCISCIESNPCPGIVKRRRPRQIAKFHLNLLEPSTGSQR
jgi:hypothetical protein